MKYECKVIEDLLPLYQDGICSEESRRAVEEHLAECPDCSKMLTALKDTTIVETIQAEKVDVIASQSSFFKRKSAIVGTVIAALFALPILICLIVDLAGGHGLGWFFIVLAAMFVPTSLFVVPLMVPKNRMFHTMWTFTASVIFLLAVVCIYTGGQWFFVAGSSVLYGLTLIFMPFIVLRRPMRERLGNKKGLTVMIAYTVTFFLMMLCIGLAVGASDFFPIAMTISLPIVALEWLIFGIIRYLPANKLTKLGTCIVILSLFEHFGSILINSAIVRVLAGGVVVYNEPSLTGMVTGVIVGGMITALGIYKDKQARENK